MLETHGTKKQRLRFRELWGESEFWDCKLRLPPKPEDKGASSQPPYPPLPIGTVNGGGAVYENAELAEGAPEGVRVEAAQTHALQEATVGAMRAMPDVPLKAAQDEDFLEKTAMQILLRFGYALRENMHDA
jgi:hypothetical protein